MKFFTNGIEISETDVIVLQDVLMNIEKWITDAIKGKINNRKKGMLKEWIPKLIADPNVASIPATDEEIINMIIARDDYKNRVEREEETQI